MSSLRDQLFGLDGNDDDGADPRRDPEPEPGRTPRAWDPEPEPEPEPEQQRDFLETISGLADEVHEAVVAPAKRALDQAGDVLKTEGVLKGPSSKLEAARRYQQEKERRHAEEVAAEKVAEVERERERAEQAEKLREKAAAIDRKLAETLLSAEEPAETSDGDDDAAAPRSPVSFISRFAAPTIEMHGADHVPADHSDPDGRHVGMTDGHHPHRAQKSLLERRHTDHVVALLQAAEGAAPPKLALLLRKLRPMVGTLITFVNSVSTWLEKNGFWVYLAQGGELWRKLPTTAAHALYGLSLCFFGGIFANTLAAYEAFHQTGWEKTKTCIHDLHRAADDLYAANLEDDLVDEDHDGIADVLQMDSRMLMSRKIELIMRTVDPTVLQQAGVGIYHGLLGGSAVCCLLSLLRRRLLTRILFAAWTWLCRRAGLDEVQVCALHLPGAFCADENDILSSFAYSCLSCLEPVWANHRVQMIIQSCNAVLQVGNMAKRPLSVFLAPTLTHILSPE